MQWDRNQTLEIYGLSLARAPEVHFSNIGMERAITRQATMDSKGVITVSVPNGLLQKPYTITVHLCQYNGATFETCYTIKIPVTERKQPADYIIESDGDVYSFNALSHEVAQAVADLKTAEQSMGEKLSPIVATKVGEAIGSFIDASLTEPGKAADAKAVNNVLTAFKASLSGTVLWENPDDSVQFDNQKIPLDLTAYKSVRIVWMYNSADGIRVKVETVSSDRGRYRVHVHTASHFRDYTIQDDGIELVTGYDGNFTKILTPSVIIGYDF
jgi:hypothetical protein